MIQNVHNCGHPSKEEFVREVLGCVRRDFECPACAAKGHPPRPRLPSALPRAFRFNETHGVDGPDGTRIIFCNMVCWGTLYHLCIPFPDKTAATVAKCITERIRSSMDAQDATVRWTTAADARTKRSGNIPLLQILMSSRTNRFSVSGWVWKDLHHERPEER